MTTACPVHDGPRILTHDAGRPPSRFFEIATRIADNFEPAMAAAFIRAFDRLTLNISDTALRSAIVSGNMDLILSASGAGLVEPIFQSTDALRNAMLGATLGTGEAAAEVVTGVTGITTRFNATDPNAIMFARTQVAELVRRVGPEVKEAIRVIVSVGQSVGLTPAKQATAISELVGLPKNWAAAPLNFESELRRGLVNSGRLLHDPRLPPAQRAGMQARVVSEIEEALAKGESSEAFITKHRKAYGRNLLQRRALNIARTETMRASNEGMRIGWRRARDDGALPDTARRVAIVTPDDRLRDTHAAVPDMNPDGVGLDEPFDTPFGPLMGPPWEPLCRCSEGLVFPGTDGVL